MSLVPSPKDDLETIFYILANFFMKGQIINFIYFKRITFRPEKNPEKEN